MDISANDLFRAILQQCHATVEDAQSSARSRALVEFVGFVALDATADCAKAVDETLSLRDIDPWDEAWVLPEIARATLEALNTWRSVARRIVERLEHAETTEATRELHHHLTALLASSDIRKSKYCE